MRRLLLLAGAAHALVAPRRPVRLHPPPLRSNSEFAADGEYLARLSSYSDEDGYVLAAPTRYSVKDWAINLQNLPASTVLSRVRGHLVANTAFACVVAAGAAAVAEYVRRSLFSLLSRSDWRRSG